jgi:transcriptional regulator with XRE-family HTH domain
MSVNDQIRDLRTQKKISQQEMADALGITQGAYNRIENGSTELKVSDLEKIAEKLEVPASVLMQKDAKVYAYNLQTGTQIHYQNIQNTMTDQERAMFQQFIQNQESRITFLENEIKSLHILLDKALSK